jgi:hypothetical protein
VQLAEQPLTLKTFSGKAAADESMLIVATGKLEGCKGESNDSERLHALVLLQTVGSLHDATVLL